MFRTGLVLAAVLAVGDIATIGLGGPPLAIAIVGALIGVITLVAIRPAWRGNRRAIITVIVTRTLSALGAVPGVFVSSVGTGTHVLAAVTVVLTIAAIVLVATGLRRGSVVTA